MEELYYTTRELQKIGFSRIGNNVHVSRKCSFYGIEGSIGSNVRIDDFCILKGRVDIGSYVHVAAYCCVSGAGGRITLSNFSTISCRVSVYTGSDIYRSNALSSSTVPEEYRSTCFGDVLLGRAALIGAHSVILPGVTVGDAASVGALCIIYKSIPAGAVAVSDPPGVRITGNRDVATILRMAEQVLAKSESL